MTGLEGSAVVVLIVVGEALAGIKSLYWLATAGFITASDAAPWFSFAHDWL